MISSIIAYSMSGFFGFLMFVSVVMVFKRDVKEGSEIYHLLLTVVLGFIAWGFARLGGI